MSAFFNLYYLTKRSEMGKVYFPPCKPNIEDLGTRKIIFLTEKCHSKRQKKAKHKIYEKIMLAISQIMIYFQIVWLLGYRKGLSISYLKRWYHNEIGNVKLFKIEMNSKQEKKICKKKWYKTNIVFMQVFTFKFNKIIFHFNFS